MSRAMKCDRCGELFEPQIGLVTIESIGVYVEIKPDGETTQPWTDLDFCASCSKDVLEVVGDAINNVAETIAEAKAEASKKAAT